MSGRLTGIGIGLRHKHLRRIMDEKPAIDWLEVHTENFFSAGSAASQCLEIIRQDYPLSAHCVGLSLGSAQPVSNEHLAQIKHFMDRFQPLLVSDHLSWGAMGGIHLPDLLPLPYTEEALHTLVQNIQRTQEALGRQILIENPSSYVTFSHSTIPEHEFLVSAALNSGCGLLLDVNNVAVSCYNHGWDAAAYLAAIPAALVQEIHLAGYSIQEMEGRRIYIDTHGAAVYPEVWELYTLALQQFEAPALIEWDTDVPELEVLLSERDKARAIHSAAKSASKERA